MAHDLPVPGPIRRLSASLRASVSALEWRAALCSLYEGRQARIETCTSRLHGLAVKASGSKQWQRCIQLLFTVPRSLVGVQLFNQVASGVELAQWALSLQVLEEALQRGHWSVVSSNAAIRAASRHGWKFAAATLVQKVGSSSRHATGFIHTDLKCRNVMLRHSSFFSCAFNAGARP